jgi:hypothetical protein
MPNIFAKNDTEAEPVYTFSKWCEKEMLGSADRDSFRKWLRHQVGSSRTNRAWWALFDRFVRKTRHK